MRIDWPLCSIFYLSSEKPLHQKQTICLLITCIHYDNHKKQLIPIRTIFYVFHYTAPNILTVRCICFCSLINVCSVKPVEDLQTIVKIWLHCQGSSFCKFGLQKDIPSFDKCYNLSN